MSLTVFTGAVVRLECEARQTAAGEASLRVRTRLFTGVGVLRTLVYIYRHHLGLYAYNLVYFGS